MTQTPLRVDANILLRYFTGEPVEQAERAAALISAVASGTTAILIEDVILAEVVWTLASYYRVSKREIANRWLQLLAEDGVLNPDKDTLRLALLLFRDRNLGFADALLVGRALAAGDGEVWSFDRDFDRIPGITRREP